MEQFKGTMDKPQQKEKVQKDIQPIDAEFKVKKTSKAKGLFKMLFCKDIFSAIKDALFDVAVPNFRDTAAKTGKNVIDQMFYDSPSKGKGGYNAIDYGSYNNYNGIYRSSAITSSNGSRPQQVRRTIYDVNTIEFASIEAVKSIIAQLQDIVKRYHFVTVSDFYDIIQQPSTNYLDDRYGWYNLDGLDWSRGRDGYVINFPRVVVIEENK